MLNFPGYEINELLFRGKRSLIFRGKRNKDSQPIVIKTHAVETPDEDEINKYVNDYNTCKIFDDDLLIRYYALEYFSQRVAIIEEDTGAQGLKESIVAESFNLKTFLEIGAQMVRGLEVIHEKGVIHKDIKPQNIIIHPGTRLIKYIDFGLSTRLKQENKRALSPNRLEGTLAYISPEQTGRMNRPVDYRSDFYSLGATFYELLTGRPPFVSRDLMELVHCHIARTPPKPDSLNNQVHSSISDLVMKLLSKNAEERYQSCSGILRDLEEIKANIDRPAQLKNFVPATHDYSAKFKIPAKIYGRDKEISILLDAFEKAANGQTVALLVEGYSGVGKSALIGEIQKPTTMRNSYFIRGKYDQYQKNVAYSAITQALRELVRAMLSESEDSIQKWKGRIIDKVGSGCRLITELVPELEIITGERPPLAEASPEEARQRFQIAFQRFLRVVANQDHPLVLFLDDLQWADSAGLELIKQILTADNFSYFLFIGSYRDNEVSETHPFIKTINEIKNAGLEPELICLKPLSEETANSLVADTLVCDENRARPLTELIFHKTEGNPFFLRMFLQSLYDHKLLQFKKNKEGAGWQWDLEQILHQQAGDNVISLMVGRIKLLPENSRRALTSAACLGNSFSSKNLSIVLSKSVEDISELLYPAINAGMLLIYENEIKFVHDRVQEAAYAFIPEENKNHKHLEIGRVLLRSLSQEEIHAQIYEITRQCNMGLSLLREREEKLRIARLNFNAAGRAMEAAAYGAAQGYYKVITKLLPTNSWQNHYNLSFQTHLGLARCYFLESDFVKLDEEFTRILARTDVPEDRVEVYILKAFKLHIDGDFQSALDTEIIALSTLGIKTPEDQKSLEQRAETRRGQVAAQLEEIGLSNFPELPLLADAKIELQIKVLTGALTRSYNLGDQHLQMVYTCEILSATLKHGLSDQAPFGFMFYALLLLNENEEYVNALKIAELGARLSGRFNNKIIEGKVLFLKALTVNHFQAPLRSNIILYKQSYEASMEGGDMVYAAYCPWHISGHKLLYGANLSELSEDIEDLLEQANAIKSSYIVDLISLNLLHIQALIKYKSKEALKLFDIDPLAKKYPGNFLFEIFVNFFNLKIQFYLGAYERAFQIADKIIQPFLKAYGGTIYTSDLLYLYLLSFCSVYLFLPDREKASRLEIAKGYLKKLKNLSIQYPENFEHKFRLLEAEFARISDRPRRAMVYYERAIESAGKNGFTQHEALANDLASSFYFHTGRLERARVYAREAIHHYRRWGALTIVHEREQYFQNINPTESVTMSITTQSKSASTGKETGILDLNTVLKASRAISRELTLETLLSEIMKIILENAGAQRGFIILKGDEEPCIQASAEMAGQKIEVLQNLSLERQTKLPKSIVRYVVRSGEKTLFQDAARETTREGLFSEDVYIKSKKPRSILCVPILLKDKIIGALYLENNLSVGAFTEERTELLEVLLAQAAISIENARMYEHLEERVKERTKELEKTHRQLLDTAHRAGMAEVASNVLHTVGNTLTNVTTPLSIILESLQESRLNSMARLLDLLNDNQDNLAEFLQNDPRGEKVIPFLTQLYSQLNAEQKKFTTQVEEAHKGAGKISDIIQLQKNYAGNILLEEELSLEEILEDALKIEGGILEQNKIEIKKHIKELPPLKSDRHKLMGILLNLIKNAREALIESKSEHKEINFRIYSIIPDRAILEVNDNGAGIKPELLTRIFGQGFSEKKNGHGFGLHNSANAATELGGKLVAFSEGHGKGATFTVELPIK